MQVYLVTVMMRMKRGRRNLTIRVMNQATIKAYLATLLAMIAADFREVKTKLLLTSCQKK